MPATSESPIPIRELLSGLTGVRTRRMFGTEAFFAGPVLFAFLAEDGLVIRLPEAERAVALSEGVARAFLGRLPEGLSGWVVIPYGTPAQDQIAAAHQLARGLARSAARKKGRTGRTRRGGRGAGGQRG